VRCITYTIILFGIHREMGAKKTWISDSTLIKYLQYFCIGRYTYKGELMEFTIKVRERGVVTLPYA
jgi:hypothetical protein